MIPQRVIPTIYPQLQYVTPQQNTSPIHTASQPKAPLRAIEPPPKAGMPSSSNAGMSSSSSADAGAGPRGTDAPDEAAGPSMGRQSQKINIINKIDKKGSAKGSKSSKDIYDQRYVNPPSKMSIQVMTEIYKEQSQKQNISKETFDNFMKLLSNYRSVKGTTEQKQTRRKEIIKTMQNNYGKDIYYNKELQKKFGIRVPRD